jgi:hypothetical protein
MADPLDELRAMVRESAVAAARSADVLTETMARVAARTDAMTESLAGLPDEAVPRLAPAVAAAERADRQLALTLAAYRRYARAVRERRLRIGLDAG